jgi:hypothetical protein
MPQERCEETNACDRFLASPKYCSVLNSVSFLHIAQNLVRGGYCDSFALLVKRGNHTVVSAGEC